MIGLIALNSKLIALLTDLSFAILNSRHLLNFRSFNFDETRIDEALRMYLETFRLPGESPVISYLLEHFADHWHVSPLYLVNWFILYLNSLGQLTSHHWPSFGKGENKGSVLLWYSCFDRSILMFLTREGLECHISISKHCLMRLWNDINQLTFVFLFAETRSIKRMWRQLTERML